MEYPGSIFSKPWRTFFLIVCMGIFFISAPITILYSMGYRYDWKNGLIKEIGAISIDVLPKNATVFINDQKIKDKLPIKLNSVSPNNYTLRITQAGYVDWTKEITVKNKQTVYIKDIHLIKKSKPELLISGSIKTLSLSPNGLYLLYELTNTKTVEIKLRSTKSPTVEYTVATFPRTQKNTISWSEKNDYFIITAPTAPFDYALVGSVNNKKLIDVVTYSQTPIQKIQWQNTNESELYYSTSAGLYSFLPHTEHVKKIAPPTFIDWYSTPNELWILQTATTTHELKLVRDPFGFSTQFTIAQNYETSTPPWSIAHITKDTVLLHQTNQNEFVLVTPTNQFKISASKYLVSSYNDWWLFWSPWELWTHVPGEHPQLLTRSGEQLLQVAPLDEHNTLLLRWAKKVTVLFPYYFVQHELLNQPIESVEVDTKNKILYFIATIDDQTGLWKLTY